MKGTEYAMKILKKDGSLRFFGQWFGRPYDNFHIPVSARLDGSVLTILFNGGEKCAVYDPLGIVNEPNDFHIERASKVVWEWYYYGREHTSENLCRRVYNRADKESASGNNYALELC